MCFSFNHIPLLRNITLQKGQENKTIKEGNPLVLSNAFFRSMFGVCQGYALDQNIELPDANCMLDIIRRY